MSIYKWFKEVAKLTLKNVWHRSREKSGDRAICIFQNNNLTNPLHPFNTEQQAMEDYNDRRAQETLNNYLQDTQSFHHKRYDY